MSEMVERVTKVIMNAYDGFSKDECTNIARAAIAAMREPTKEMVEAASDAALAEDAASVWGDMIDAALTT